MVQEPTWLLDYHKYTNETNKYKLFFATNLHVLAKFSNSLEKSVQEKLNYYDPTNDKVVAVALGKSANVTNFDQKANKTTSNGYSPVTYFTNSSEFINYEKSNVITPYESNKCNIRTEIGFCCSWFYEWWSYQKYSKWLEWIGRTV
nr:hypothetical protein [Mycoplasmopsis bovis]